MVDFRFSVRLVKSLTDEELDDVLKVILAAYQGSTAVRIMTGGHDNLRDPLFRSMTRACLLAGETYIATSDETGEIVGNALWFPPGKELWTDDEQRVKSGFNDFLAMAPPDVQDWWINTYSTALNPFLKEIYKPDTILDSWYLNNIVVDPQHQRKGIATEFFNVIRRKAEPNALIALGTDSERNVIIYQQIGFVVKGRSAVPSPWGEIPVWAFAMRAPN
ncbi:hypothetical protein BJ138DRAFT_612912 [Hygrophoropsis aurantiaca]|uniref:Uncharacterized protein n=1 Tax=Hygrophoropsis aurantiaca TaxID=72124 RepID=A0ACB8AJ00_9AGAM|nr:hypothetical protein BJ138DRAFT_612912 [Hygrophoropsis aurantiaca]